MDTLEINAALEDAQVILETARKAQQKIPGILSNHPAWDKLWNASKYLRSQQAQLLADALNDPAVQQ